MQVTKALASSGRSFPALDNAKQLAKHGARGDSMLQQDVDSLLTSQWSIQAVPDLTCKKHDLGLLRQWLSVSTHNLLCFFSLHRQQPLLGQESDIMIQAWSA